jgi:energy-converting hydrogenase Eha subunit B
MTSLTEVYDGSPGAVASLRQLYLGAGLFLTGAVLVVAGIAVGTTDLLAELGRYEARELAGTLAGLGIPAVLLGVFAVLPAARRTRATAVLGTTVSVLGVLLFRAVYPYNWVGAPTADAGATLAATAVYGVGVLTTFWCLFLAVATFKTRNEPGGTVRMQVTERGTTRIVEASNVPGFGSVGLFGDAPDGNVETQTNRPEPTSQPEPEPTPTADGGSAAVDGEGDDEFVEAAQVRGQPDRYCGNCTQFKYVRTEEGIQPYCGLTDELMDDMDACEDWEQT